MTKSEIIRKINLANAMYVICNLNFNDLLESIISQACCLISSFNLLM